MKIGRGLGDLFLLAIFLAAGCKGAPPKEATEAEKQIVFVDASSESSVALMGSGCRAGRLIGGVNWATTAVAEGANVVQLFPFDLGAGTVDRSASGVTIVNQPVMNARSWTCPAPERFLRLYRTLPGVAR